MGIFSRKENKEFFSSLEEDVTKSFMESENLKEKKSEPNPLSLTKDEVLGYNKQPENTVEIPSGTSPLEALKIRMLGQNSDKVQVPDKKAEVKKNDTVKETVKNSKIPAEKFVIDESADSNITIDEEPDTENVKQPPKHAETLLQKCKPYTMDEDGNDVTDNSPPLYKLESVAQILRSDSENALKELSQKYNLSFENETEFSKTVTSINSEDKADKNITAEKEETVTEKSGETKPSGDTVAIPIISDIDSTPLTHTAVPKIANDGATVRFTPIKDPKANTNSISISSITKKIDIQSELENDEKIKQKNFENTILELTEFEEFETENEYDDKSKTKHILRKLSLNKRNSFLMFLLSFLLSFVILLFIAGPLNTVLIRNSKTVLTIFTVLYAVNILANISAFFEFKTFKGKHFSSDIICGINAIFSLIFAVFAISSKSIDGYYLILLSSIILTVRAYFKFTDSSTLLNNFKKISHNRPKKAVAFISDASTTYSMAKNSIEGDVLIAAPRHTDFVSDFIKYSTFGTKLNGKLRIVAIISVVLALITALSSGYFYHSAYNAFFGAAVIMCITSLPTLFFIDSMPSAFAASKLNKKGSMIAGKTGAEKIETANAAVISTSDIFPSGTVTLQSMKILSENNIDDTILRAASLTEAVDSTLAPIFKQIAGTNKSYTLPDSDTVKYESKMGLSGWVADELLFIGNRTLMEAHGITVPSIETDYKILRQGFFPVYLASGGKACAMIVIQYNVNESIAKELNKITGLGVTLLISNSDPNINEEMLSDYFGIYKDYIKILDNVGLRMYKSANIDTDVYSAPAVFSGSNLNLITVMNCASKIKKSNTLLSVLYVLFTVICAITFIYSSFSGDGSLLFSAKNILTLEVISSIISFIAFLFYKP